MKQYKSLAEAKRSLATQIVILTFAAILIFITGRLLAHNRFPVSHIISYDIHHLAQAGNVTIRWQNEDIEVMEKDLHGIRPGDENMAAKAAETEYNVKDNSADNPIMRNWIEGGKLVKDWIKTAKSSGQLSGTVNNHMDILRVTMLPKKTGKYVMKVFDLSGKELFRDEIFVSRFHTAFSKQTGRFTGDESLIIAGILYFIGLTIIMLVFFRRLEGPLAYSYEAILSCGVFIFALVSLIIGIPLYIYHLIHPELYPTWRFFCDIAAGGKYFTILTAPVMIVFSILLIISNIELLRHERPRLQNILGLLLGISLIVGEVMYYIIYSGVYPVSQKHMFFLVSAENIIGITFTYFECVLFSSLICGFWAAQHVPAFNRDYILILGCGFRKDGTLPPLLKGRVNKAMDFWYKQKEKTGKEAIVIPSGGQGKDEVMSESQAMYQYMVSTGFPEKAIVREDKSTNTYQNMKFSKSIIEKLSPKAAGTSDAPVNTVFVTTNYHVFRSGVWAGRAGLFAEGLGSRTKWWFWPNAFIRECLGLFKNCLGLEFLGLGFMILSFAVITWLVYL